MYFITTKRMLEVCFSAHPNIQYRTMEALSHQGVKGEEYTADLIGKGAKKTGRTVQRYVRLTYLLPELLEYVDLKKLLLLPAEKLSFITAEEQGWVLGVILDKRLFPNEIQAEALKDESKAGTLNKKRVTEILISDSKMPSMPKITLSPKKLRDYFPKEYTKGQIEAVIYDLLESWRDSHKVG